MARVHHRKARKDYPDHGISKGDMYYTASIKTGPRSSRTLRSLKPLRPSQLTTSPFKSGYFGIQEGWEDDPSRDGQTIRDAAEAIRELGEAADESYNNMPEGLQEGDTGQMLYERADQCETKAGELEQLADEYDELEEPTEPVEPEEPEEPEEPDDDEAENFFELTEAWETYKDQLSEYEMAKEEYESELEDFETAQAEYESEQERIMDEAGEHIGDMPE